MAGSYAHIVNDDGSFRGVDLLDHLGDAYEAIEEMYGMIWYLASIVPNSISPSARLVEEARQNYKIGLQRSPGIKVKEL